MNKPLRITSVAAFWVLVLGGCGGGSSGGITPPPPPPPPVDQSSSGIWEGQSVTPVLSPDVSTSFEFDATGPFEVGTSPFSARFSTGEAETRGDPDLYITGANAWHVLVGTNAIVNFSSRPMTLSFWVRTENAGDVAEIRIFDEEEFTFLTINPTEVYQEIVVERMPDETEIGGVVVTSTSGGDVVIDDFTFGYTETIEDVACLVSSDVDITCIVADAVTDKIHAGITGTVQVSDDQISGSGMVYGPVGAPLLGGIGSSSFTISAGTVDENTTLDFTMDRDGTVIEFTTSFSDTYDRGSDLATVAASYSTFDIFGDDSSFVVDGAGVIMLQSTSGCVGNGQVSVFDASINAYAVSIDITGCGVPARLPDGTYDGFGTMQDDIGMNDVFIFAAFLDGEGFIAGQPTK